MAREQEGGVNPGAAADWRKCDMSAADISQVLEERRVGELSRLLYVAAPSLNVSQVRARARVRVGVRVRARAMVRVRLRSG